MRNRVTMLTAALVLASATLAMAQTTAAESGTAAKPTSGSIDFGFRTTTTSGDEARYERYQDPRSGAYTNIVFGKETAESLMGFTAKNIGYHDQKYGFDYQNSKLKVNAFFDAIPLNYCYNCLTPWQESGKGTWTLDTLLRSQVQSSRYPAPVTPLPAGYVAIPTNYAQSQMVSVYRGIAKTFEMQQRRDTFGVGLNYALATDIDVSVGVQSAHKTGYQPFGMSYAFSNANELPLPLDNRTNDLVAAVEWVKPQGMFRAAYEYSMFTNKFNQLEWDNPLNVTDYSNGKVPPLGPYDPSGYSNGNGAAKGRISMFPDNSMTTVSFMGLYKFNRSTSLNGTFQVINMTQNDDLIPWTTNSQINQPLVWATFPSLASLPRNTAEAEVRGVNGLINFSSRPTRKVGVTMKYRHNTHANMSNPFPYEENVRFDAVPEESGTESRAHSVIRDTFDASLSYNVMAFSTLRIGYGYDNFNRTSRSHNDMRDQAIRLSWDTVGGQYLTFRLGYEMVARTGYGFSVHAVEEGGGQPGLRYYDEADRDRNRLSAIATFAPNEKMDLTASVAYGKDEYGGPGLEFGLLDNTNTAYNIGVNFMPNDTMAFGMNYGRDAFSSMQKSRNANPAPHPTWTDPNFDWTLDNDEKVNNFDIYVDLLGAISKTDIRFAYNYSDSDNAFVHGGPRIATLASIKDANGFSTFEALPNVTNTWNRFTADVDFHATAKIGVGLSVWYEKFDVTDFATINLAGTQDPRIDYLGGLTTGYGNRPYTGTTVVAKMMYFF